MTEPVFGIDFGTTNTRIAFHDGHKVRLVPVRTGRGLSFLIPTVVGFCEGSARYFGQEALDHPECDRVQDVKWHLNQEEPLSVGGISIDPVEVASAFFKFLRKVADD